jgi:RHS repeat-associated protein
LPAWNATQGGGGVYNRHLDADLDGDNDAFDKSTSDKNYMAAGDSFEVSGWAWSPSGMDHGYTGRRLDPETLLMEYRARAYHPFLKTFTQRDPMGYMDSASLYQHVAGNPLGHLDPFGFQSVNPGGAAGPGAIAAARGAMKATIDAFVQRPTIQGLQKAKELLNKYCDLLESLGWDKKIVDAIRKYWHKYLDKS